MDDKPKEGVMTYSVSELYEYLKTELPDEDNRLFGFAKHNHIGTVNESLFDTPHDRWSTPDLPSGHSARFLTAISDHVAAATRLVDILTMERPTGLFFRALTRAFERIANAGLPNVVTVRLLMGKTAHLGVIKIEEMLDDIAKAMGSHKGRIDFYVGQIRWESASWNHAKVIAVDGKAMIVGGHNLWAPDYLEKEPVFDLSLRMEGQAVHGAHQFAESLWGFVRQHQGSAATYSHRLNPNLEREWNKSPDVIKHEPVPHSGAIPALWVTCPGWGVFFDRNNQRVIKDGAVLCFERALAKATHCRMSLQDLGTEEMRRLTDFREYAADGHPYKLIACKGHYFILPIIDAIAKFLSRPADNSMEIVLTSPVKGGKAYSHGVPPSVIYNVISYRMSKLGLNKEACLKRFQQRLTLGSVSFDQGRHRWPGSNDPIHNHAKFWLLDEKLLYVGSGNQYPYVKSILNEHIPGYHPEFGILADLPQATARMIIENYYGKLVEHSHRAQAKKEDMTWDEGADAAAVAAAGASDGLAVASSLP
jgi:hypothetical protein